VLRAVEVFSRSTAGAVVQVCKLRYTHRFGRMERKMKAVGISRRRLAQWLLKLRLALIDYRRQLQKELMEIHHTVPHAGKGVIPFPSSPQERVAIQLAHLFSIIMSLHAASGELKNCRAQVISKITRKAPEECLLEYSESLSLIYVLLASRVMFAEQKQEIQHLPYVWELVIIRRHGVDEIFRKIGNELLTIIPPELWNELLKSLGYAEKRIMVDHVFSYPPKKNQETEE